MSLRVLVACEFSGVVRDAFRVRGHDAWSCDLLETERPGLHYQGDVRHLLDGWVPVRHSAECDPNGDGWCQVADCDPAECKCLGPTQDGVEYLETEHGLFGRPATTPSWDMMLGFPPCTYVCSSGMHWISRGRIEADGRLRSIHHEEAIEFFRSLLDAPIQRIALENPIGALSKRVREPDQIIQPWQFGEDASKATCLWLKNLLPLQPTVRAEARRVGGEGKDLFGGETGTPRFGNQCDSGQNNAATKDRWKNRSRTFQGIADAMAAQWGGLA